VKRVRRDVLPTRDVESPCQYWYHSDNHYPLLGGMGVVVAETEPHTLDGAYEDDPERLLAFRSSPFRRLGEVLFYTMFGRCVWLRGL
jgi:hypothetical protein